MIAQVQDPETFLVVAFFLSLFVGVIALLLGLVIAWRATRVLERIASALEARGPDRS